MSTTNDTAVRPFTISEMAGLYGVSLKTLRTWLQPHQPAIGPRRGRYYTILQVRSIFSRLGPPDGMEEE